MPATFEPEAEEIAEAIREGLRRNGHGRPGNGNSPFDTASGAGALLRDGDAGREAATRIAHATLTASSKETAAHSEDVDVIAEGICEHLGIVGRERRDILTAARLHDIGKVAVPDSILHKPGPLDPDEWAVIRTHTEVGDEILRSVPALAGVARLVRHSHERWDGEGYPDGLAGEDIPLGSRIVFCADSFHAIRSDRVYRRGRSASAALREVQAGSGSQFDPEVVAALVGLRRDLQGSTRGLAMTGRSGRLVALLLVVSCGMGGAALAHSGLFRDTQAEATTVPSPQRAAPAVGPALRVAPGLFEIQKGGGLAECAGGTCSDRGVGGSSPARVPTPGHSVTRGSRTHRHADGSDVRGVGGPNHDRTPGGAHSAGGVHSSHGQVKNSGHGGSPGQEGSSGHGGHGQNQGTGASGQNQGTGASGQNQGTGASPPSQGETKGDGHDHSGEDHGNGNAYGHSGGMGNPNPGSGGNAYGHSGGNGNGNGNGHSGEHLGSGGAASPPVAQAPDPHTPGPPSIPVTVPVPPGSPSPPVHGQGNGNGGKHGGF